MTDPAHAGLEGLVRELLDRHPDGLLPLVTAGHPVLRRRAQAYEGQLTESTFDALVAAMRTTMHAAPGVGLAAPQVGLDLAVAVAEDAGVADAELAEARERSPLPFRVLINPRYEAAAADRVAFYEGCLSVPGLAAVRSRWRSVVLAGTDRHGGAAQDLLTGWSARIVQHETDHLGGTLYLDRAEPRSLAMGAAAAHWAAEPAPVAAARALGFDLAGAGDDPRGGSSQG